MNIDYSGCGGNCLASQSLNYVEIGSGRAQSGNPAMFSYWQADIR
jgi:hypothetical protein